ncbi:hypothetical protein Zmor_004595 [Zophobas morio]|uniref:Endopeptidase Clp n=1 Tax=Zophobas morio TaxID=2755281 RepID=A0AA38MJQ8_9CUCU|nr:hypothetical protein Zmor_004595 [Zophobas morio]
MHRLFHPPSAMQNQGVISPELYLVDVPVSIRGEIGRREIKERDLLLLHQPVVFLGFVVSSTMGSVPSAGSPGGTRRPRLFTIHPPPNRIHPEIS